MPNGQTGNVSTLKSSGTPFPESDKFSKESPPDGAETSTPTETEAEGKSCLIPKSIFPRDPGVGDTVTMSIEAIFGDEVECSVSSENTETSTQEPQLTADEEIEAAGEEMA